MFFFYWLIKMSGTVKHMNHLWGNLPVLWRSCFASRAPPLPSRRSPVEWQMSLEVHPDWKMSPDVHNHHTPRARPPPPASEVNSGLLLRQQTAVGIWAHFSLWVLLSTKRSPILHYTFDWEPKAGDTPSALGTKWWSDTNRFYTGRVEFNRNSTWTSIYIELIDYKLHSKISLHTQTRATRIYKHCSSTEEQTFFFLLSRPSLWYSQNIGITTTSSFFNFFYMQPSRVRINEAGLNTVLMEQHRIYQISWGFKSQKCCVAKDSLTSIFHRPTNKEPLEADVSSNVMAEILP